MSRQMLGKIRKVLINEAGQMSVFVALIFQVLFVFFAMVVNIGLLVHDKINLQNAVDLGAYYAAERQAEIMNEIAHINYQIRQDYKLLTWRYRVLGTLGRKISPSITPPGMNLPDSYRFAPNGNYEEIPAVCATHDQWFEYAQNSQIGENLCHRDMGRAFPPVPQLTIIAPWVPGIFNAQAAGRQALRAQRFACDNAGPLNWGLAMYMLYAYKQSVALRKQEIWRLRELLVKGDMEDLSRQSVRVGVEKTIKKNLTTANQNEFEFELMNGMSEGTCASGAMPGEVAMPEILTAPLLVYINIGNRCTVSWALHNNPPPNRGYVDQTGFFAQLAAAEPQPNHPLHSSLGFEKNPWCMAYVGVKAKAKPHKPFAPFGKPIQIEARAFAQPFGGRIGPWFKSGWPQNSPRSGSGQRVDPLTTPRVEPGAQAAYNASGVTSDAFPNFSRFPGDQLGLRSQRAIGAQRMMFSNLYSQSIPQRLQVAWYMGFDNLGLTGDPLAWSEQDPPQGPPNPSVEMIRKAEAAAVAPDLFDITYYSIDPHFYTAYFSQGPGNASFGNTPLMVNGAAARPGPDIGARHQTALQSFDVASQIAIASTPDSVADSNLNQGLYWLVRDWQHLLTGWVSASTTNFNLPMGKFGACSMPAAEKVMIPGGCAQGGRTGYSVRLISREHLLFDGWKIGGDGEAPGKILNPPPTAF